MKRIVSGLLVFLCLCAGVVSGQDEERPIDADVGFLRIVNLADAGEGNLRLTMNGKDHWPQGFKLGDRTGGFKVPSGEVEFTMRKDGCKGAKRQIDVVRGKTVTLVCYADPKKDENGKIEEWELKIATLNQQSEPEGLFFTIVSFFAEDEVELTVRDSLSEKEQKVVAPKRRAVRVKVEHGLVNVRISHEGDVIKELSTKRRGNYVVMFYTDANEEKKSVTFYDRRFVIGN